MGELSLYALGNYVLPPDSINTKLTTMTIAHFTRMHNVQNLERLLKNGEKIVGYFLTYAKISIN